MEPIKDGIGRPLAVGDHVAHAYRDANGRITFARRVVVKIGPDGHWAHLTGGRIALTRRLVKVSAE